MMQYAKPIYVIEAKCDSQTVLERFKKKNEVEELSEE
jgi:hypothetical protein